MGGWRASREGRGLGGRGRGLGGGRVLGMLRGGLGACRFLDGTLLSSLGKGWKLGGREGQRGWERGGRGSRR